MVVIKIRDDDDDVVMLGGDSKEDVIADIFYTGYIVAHTLSKIKDIPIEAAAIEIMQTINYMNNEIPMEDNENE